MIRVEVSYTAPTDTGGYVLLGLTGSDGSELSRGDNALYDVGLNLWTCKASGVTFAPLLSGDSFQVTFFNLTDGTKTITSAIIRIVKVSP